LKIANPAKLKGKNITLSISYEIPDYVASGAIISKVAFRNTEDAPKKVIKYGLYASVEMRLSGLL
jgi:hypothetical protein